IDEKGKRTELYYIIRDLNREIQALAPVFLGAVIDDVAFTGPEIPATTHRLTLLPDGFGEISSDGPGIVVSQFHNADSRYILLVNRDIDHAQTVTLPRPRGLKIFNTDGTTRPDNPTENIVIPPGGYYLISL
ncbi:MAG: hypothetical protein K2M98_01830, partial [Muribaculum sp.]|nr:hypothetical protein [Muribaculum sp.]